MFTGNKTAAICCFFINNVKEFIYSLLELFFFQIIGTLVNMKVSISGMSEGFDNKTTFFSGLTRGKCIKGSYYTTTSHTGWQKLLLLP